ncbi:MAG: VTT domain-containing protein [Acetobacteraceae bacterium]
MEQTPLKRGGMGKLLRACLIVIVLAGIMTVARYVPVAANFTRVVASWQHSPWAPVIFCLLGIFYAAFGMPRQALCAVAGLIFGVVMGLSLAMAATLLGNLIDFYLARIMRQRRNRDGQATPPTRLWQKKMESFGHVARNAPFCAILMLRLMPVGSALLVALGAGYYDIGVSAFIAGTLLGSLPQNLVFVLIGSGSHLGRGSQITVEVLLFALSMMLGILIMRHRQEKF